MEKKQSDDNLVIIRSISTLALVLDKTQLVCDGIEKLDNFGGGCGVNSPRILTLAKNVKRLLEL